MNHFDWKRARAGLGGFAAALTVAAITAVGAGAAGSGGIGTGDSGGRDGVFPVKGKHSYGDGLGAGRGHQGVDIMARCGKKIVAAQPGRVQWRDYQGSGAGHYLVIDGKGKRHDTVYMHLKRRAKVGKRARVEAGEVIGRVGTTGRSSACHLHFEMWRGDWQRGGKPINPKPHLRRWDRKRKR